MAGGHIARRSVMLEGMAIPGFQQMMLPVLEITADGQEHRLRDLVEAVADRFKLSDEDRSETVPSGQQTIIHNRVAWARTYLVKAGLLDPTRRGFVRISDGGRTLIANKPSTINIAFLKEHYPVIQKFIAGSDKSGEEKVPVPASESDITPEEALEQAYQRLRAELADELLAQVKQMTPAMFERLVVELLVKMGYGGSLKDAGRAVGRSGDNGIDGIIKEDRLGLDTIYIQAKRYADQPIGRPDIQAFVGALQGVRARKGVFITTSRFSDNAHDYVSNIDTKVVLIDGEQLTEYMIDFDLGVAKMSTFEVKRLDSDYFDEN